MDSNQTGSTPTAAGNMISANDVSSLGFAVMGKNLKAMDKSLINTLRTSQLIEKTWKNIHGFASKAAGLFGITGKGGGSSGLGMAAMPNTGSLSTGQKIGLGAVGGTALAAAGFSALMPNTMSAVTQRMAAETAAGVSGMSPRQMILGANNIIARKGMGATSAYSPTMAASAMLYQGGVAFGSKGSRNVLGATAGLSALTGGTNEQIAGAYSAFNGNNMLSYGIKTRDAKGEQRKPYQIINELWNFLYKGKKVTKEQVAIVFNPGSPSYAMVMNAAGGDPTMFSILANGLLAKATTSGAVRNLTEKSLASSNAALDLAGVPKNSVFRSNFKNNSAQNKLLGATEKGLVGGYTSALDTNAALTNGFASMAAEVQGVTDALGNLKGFLQTMPGTGGVGGNLTNMATTAGSFALQYGLMKRAMGGGGGAAGAEAKAASGVMGSLGKVASKAAPILGKAAPLLGTAVSAYSGYKGAKGRHGFSFSDLLKSTATGAVVGGGIGAVAGGVTAVPGAILGGLVSGGGNAIGQLFGMGGGDSSVGGGAGGKTGGMALQPPVNGPITSGFGPRQAAHDKNPGISSNHTGIDYGVPVGTPVKAAGNGIVTETGLHRQYGNYIIIKHGKKSTLYAHLSKIMVGTGTKVQGGQAIGLSGGKKGAAGAGNSTGPHVHFEVRNNGSVGAQGRENPAGLFGKLFSSFKSAGIAGLNFVKKAVNKISGKDIFSFSDTASGEDPFNFSRTSDVVGLNNTSIANTMKYAYRSGAPISFADIQGSKEGANAGKYSFGAKVPDSKGNLIKTNVNASVDPSSNAVSGDKGGMAGGSRAGLMKLLYRAGFRGAALETAFSVALAESGGMTHAHNGKAPDDSYGMFQINMIGDLMSQRLGKKWRGADGSRFKLSSVNDLYDPMTNAKVAYHMSKHGTNWSAWSTYTGGSFVKFLDDARSAAIKAKIPSYDVGTSRVPEDQLAMVHKDEMILTAAEANKVRNGVASSGGTANINVNMKVTLNNSSPQQAEKLLNEFKKRLSEDLKHEKMGIF